MGAKPVDELTNEPADLYHALDEHPAEARVVLDFDETLWFRNSTEMFLDSVRPRFLAALVLQVLGFIRPWRLFSSGKPNHYRDWMRVLAVLCVAPWSLAMWRRRAADLGPKFVNKRLLAAVLAKHPERVATVSFGFKEIIEPLLAAIDPRLTLVASCSLREGAALRVQGKAQALNALWGSKAVRQSLSITDSLADADLLAASGKAFLVRWPEAHYQQAGLRPLMPFVYLQRVKRPGEKYLRNAVLGHDFPVLLLAFALASANPALASGAILVFLVAFFSAYETGYYENDRLGLILEQKPKISPKFYTIGQSFDPWFAWSVAVALSGAASWLAYDALSWLPAVFNLQDLMAFLAVWAAFLAYLVAMRILFRWQNVIEPKGRLVPMLGLQVGRTLGYAAVLPTTVVGALFCVIHGVSRWLPYVVYRFGGSREGMPNHLNCLLLLALTCGAMAIGGGLDAFLTWQAAAIFAYVGLRAAKDSLAFGPALRPLPRCEAYIPSAKTASAPAQASRNRVDLNESPT